MTSTILGVLSQVFGLIWILFTSWNIPGTNITPGAWFVFLVVASLTIRFVMLWLMSPHHYQLNADFKKVNDSYYRNRGY